MPDVFYVLHILINITHYSIFSHFGQDFQRYYMRLPCQQPAPSLPPDYLCGNLKWQLPDPEQIAKLLENLFSLPPPPTQVAFLVTGSTGLAKS